MFSSEIKGCFQRLPKKNVSVYHFPIFTSLVQTSEKLYCQIAYLYFKIEPFEEVQHHPEKGVHLENEIYYLGYSI